MYEYDDWFVYVDVDGDGCVFGVEVVYFFMCVGFLKIDFVKFWDVVDYEWEGLLD